MTKSKVALLVIGMIMGLTISGIGTYAATSYAIESKNVEYEDNSNLGVTNVQAAIDGTCTKFSTELTSLKQDMIDTIYPVGSVYISETDDTVSDVESRFGGTWIAYGTGKTLIGAGTGTDANGTSQTFSVSNNSSNLGNYNHQHKLPIFRAGTGTTDADNQLLINWNGSQFGVGSSEEILNGAYGQITVTGSAGTRKATPYLSSSTSNMIPYVTVYMYKRTK